MKMDLDIVTLPNFHLGGGDSIERILRNYTRQKQINEEHRKINGELREKVKELEIDLITVYMKGFEDGKDKYEKKIKDEIEELNLSGGSDGRDINENLAKELTIEILYKILEESEEE